MRRLVAFANHKLGNAPRQIADEEDVALSAFHGFLIGAEAKRFSRLSDREDLWRILVVLTERKVVGHLRRELAEKRGGGRVRTETDVKATAPQRRPTDELSALEPSPQFAAEMREQIQQRLDELGDPVLRSVALARLAGHTNPEIAEQLGLSLRGVERRVYLIRRKWEELADGSPGGDEPR